MSCCMLNFSRYFSSHSGIPLTIFTIITPNISSSQLYLVISGERGLSFRVDILSTILSYPSATLFLRYFFLDWYFPSTERDIFPSLGFCIVSIWGCFKFVSVTRCIKLFHRNYRGWKKSHLDVYKSYLPEPDFLLAGSSLRFSAE